MRLSNCQASAIDAIEGETTATSSLLKLVLHSVQTFATHPPDRAALTGPMIDFALLNPFYTTHSSLMPLSRNTFALSVFGAGGVGFCPGGGALGPPTDLAPPKTPFAPPQGRER